MLTVKHLLRAAKLQTVDKRASLIMGKIKNTTTTTKAKQKGIVGNTFITFNVSV